VVCKSYLQIGGRKGRSGARVCDYLETFTGSRGRRADLSREDQRRPCLVVGLMLGFLGAIPIAIIGSLIHGDWSGVWILLGGSAVALGVKALSFLMASLIERAQYGTAYA
jgi:hypothetical protein